MVDRSPHVPPQPLNVRVELGRANLPVAKAEKLAPGSVVTLDSLVDEPVDIVIEGCLVARGEVLVLEGNFCIRITELVPRHA